MLYLFMYPQNNAALALDTAGSKTLAVVFG
jgi:hypothetical protein